MPLLIQQASLHKVKSDPVTERQVIPGEQLRNPIPFFIRKTVLPLLGEFAKPGESLDETRLQTQGFPKMFYSVLKATQLREGCRPVAVPLGELRTQPNRLFVDGKGLLHFHLCS